MAQPSPLFKHVLSYQGEDYKIFYQDEFITDFYHSPLAVGATDPKEALDIVTRLNQFAQKETQNIFFNPEMLTGNQLTGGACSVVSLQVAKKALEILEHLATRHTISNETQEKIFSHQIRHFIDQLNHNSTSTKKHDEERRKHIRSVQQAFNTITVKREIQTPHVVKDKITTLAAYYHLQVSKSTQEIKGDEDLEVHFHEQMKQLGCGVYLLRIIDYKYNHKLEEQGHSVTYIKTPFSEFYFDPALGFYSLFKEAVKTHLIYHALLSAKIKFKVDQLSFHKLEINPHRHEELLQQLSVASSSELNTHSINLFFDGAIAAEESGYKPIADAIRKKAIRFIRSASPNSSSYSFISPTLTGPFSVGIARYYLEDATRQEIYLGHLVNHTRRLEMDVHYPGVHDSQAPYKVFSLLNQEKIEDSKILSRSQPFLEPSNEKKFPILIFSHGLGASPEDYQHVVEELASHGFCVISVNHSYSGLFSRHLGTKQGTLKKMDEQKIIQEGGIKAQDIEFIIDQILSEKIEDFEELLGKTIQRDSIGVLGHSLGGSAAIQACHSQSAIQAVVNMDGRILPSSLATMKQPVLLLTATLEKNREVFEQAYQDFLKQNPQMMREDFEAFHSDFSLASSYRVKTNGKFTPLQLELNQAINKSILAFFQKHLTQGNL